MYVCVCVCVFALEYIFCVRVCVSVRACVCVRMYKVRTVEPVNLPWKAVNTPSKGFHIRTIQAPASL